ncbi:simple sugar transport system substrate-binding protein [Azospirillum fermentarium]|uniref:BMP family ABC transporter substrate-binding protein n=1 Tax=Azospirillum fermentarium TaxID=1233114 RepID=UPI0022274507|nr:BMP family ABC transporter substrate-binding protein [Azospirillum fermentarium]MCW2245767.1 simple sugar transport system substrate-binding protein [Azospirillum fermentarium]
MTDPFTLRPMLSRRGFLAAAGAGAGLVLAGSMPPGRAAGVDSGAPFTVGILYKGPRADFGYNQAHADAARHMAALPGVTLDEVEYDPGGRDAALAGLAGRGDCGLIVATRGGGAVSELLSQATAHPRTVFLIYGDGMEGMRLPSNVITYEGLLNEAQHISGLVAGYAGKRPGMRGRSIGFVAAARTPRALRSINAFALGVRRADPTATVRLAVVGDGATPEQVAEAAQALVHSHGAEVLAGYLDSLRPVCAVAEANGVLCCGLHTNLSFAAPQGFLTGAEWEWGTFYAETAAAVRRGGGWPASVRGGFAAGLVRNSPYGPAVSAEARAHADAARMQLANGNAAVFRGPLTDNNGRVVLPRGKTLSSSDGALDSMAWLVDGVTDVSR